MTQPRSAGIEPLYKIDSARKSDESFSRQQGLAQSMGKNIEEPGVTTGQGLSMGLSGAAAGAGTGFMVGGPPGAAVGAAVGAGIGLLAAFG